MSRTCFGSEQHHENARASDCKAYGAVLRRNTFGEMTACRFEGLLMQVLWRPRCLCWRPEAFADVHELPLIMYFPKMKGCECQSTKSKRCEIQVEFRLPRGRVFKNDAHFSSLLPSFHSSGVESAHLMRPWAQSSRLLPLGLKHVNSIKEPASVDNTLSHRHRAQSISSKNADPLSDIMSFFIL